MDILIIAVLIIAAVILFLVELFVIPGISLAGISALVCILYALLCVCQFRYGRRIYHSWHIGDCLHRIIDLVYAIENAGQTGIEKGY